MIGPLIAFGILMLAPGAYDAVFVVSLCAALIGLAILVLFVDNRLAPAAAQPQRAAITISAVARLLRASDVRALVVAGGALNLATMSDAFLYLTLQRRLEFQVGFFPLLYVATAAIYMVLALPMGLLADRIGRTRVFIGSYVLLLLAYSALLLAIAGHRLSGRILLLLGCLLCGHRWRADGARERPIARRSAHQRDGAVDDGRAISPDWRLRSCSAGSGRGAASSLPLVCSEAVWWRRLCSRVSCWVRTTQRDSR